MTDLPTMSRSDQPSHQNVQHFIGCPTEKRSFHVWGPTSMLSQSTNVPVVLFQSGHHSTSSDHTFLLERIAQSGFIVIAPAKRNDKACGILGILGFLSGCSCASQDTDGSNLQATLAWATKAKARGNHELLSRADLSKVAVMGFSMGAQEAVHMQARYPDEVSAVIILSGSLMIPSATIYGCNPCCSAFAGGTCMSDTPLSICCGMANAMKRWTIPSLHITSEGDLVRSGTYRSAKISGSIGGGESHLITFKENALNLEIPRTMESTHYRSFMCLDCYGCPMKGARHHFALGHEPGPAHEPITAFLRQVFYSENITLTSEKIVNGEVPVSCCDPFFAFHSCWAC